MSDCCTPQKIPLNVDKFRLAIPEFADPTKYPDELIELYWDQATCILEDYGCECREMQLFLATAHLLRLHQNILMKPGNKQGGFVQSSTVDKVSVSRVAPPVADMWEWWWSQTPYGQQLLAMLQSELVGGFGVGGLPEGDAFRKVYGIF